MLPGYPSGPRRHQGTEADDLCVWRQRAARRVTAPIRHLPSARRTLNSVTLRERTSPGEDKVHGGHMKGLPKVSLARTCAGIPTVTLGALRRGDGVLSRQCPQPHEPDPTARILQTVTDTSPYDAEWCGTSGYPHRRHPPGPCPLYVRNPRTGPPPAHGHHGPFLDLAWTRHGPSFAFTQVRHHLAAADRRASDTRIWPTCGP
jgi:hypothetical protein